MPTLIKGFPTFDPVAFEDVENPTDLQVIFNLQRLLMSACEIESLPPDVAFWITNDALAGEASEAIEVFRDYTKPWKRNQEIDLAAVKEEVVDELFFVLQAAILLGMTSEELVALYKQKNTKNFQRIMEKMHQTEEMVG